MTTARVLDPTGRPVPPQVIQHLRDRAAGTPPRARADVGGWKSQAFAYNSADLVSQEMAEWFPVLRSPDTEINQNRDRMVARTRDLVRNDGWATGGINEIADGVVGSHFRLRAMPAWRTLARYAPGFDNAWADEFAAVVEGEWQLYAEDPGFHCDVTRRDSLVQMLYTQFVHKVRDGECITKLDWLPDQVAAGGARWATTLQLIDPDRLSNPYEMMDTADLRGGVEIDAFGAPIAYHIRQAHQNDYYQALESMIWDRVPRETAWGRPVIIHDAQRDRIDQHRGLGVLNPVLSRLKMLTRYDSAELQQAVLQTVFGTFIKSPFDPDQVNEALQDAPDGDYGASAYQGMRSDWHEHNSMAINGVKMPLLAPGEDIVTVTAKHPNAGSDIFQHGVLRSVSAAIGITGEQLTKDWSKANYSSLRAAMLGAYKTLRRRSTGFASGTVTPIYGAWLEEFIDRNPSVLPKGAPGFGEMRAAYVRCRWIGPGKGWVDPVKERQGEVLGLDAGFSTLDNACAEMSGSDWRETVDQRAREVDYMKQRGLALPDWTGGLPVSESDAKPAAQ